jgi:quinol-cytochrome oxidoreductase complex cytochrome b subunit
MEIHKLFLSITEALMIYGLIIVGYGILAIHITQTWSGDWPVDRNIPWLTPGHFRNSQLCPVLFWIHCLEILKIH